MKPAAVLVLMLMLIGTPAIAAGISGTFTDDDGSPHEPDINGIAAAGITLGCGGTNYCPKGSVTRAEMATFLVRSLKLPPIPSGPFGDVAGNIHAENINALAAAGVTTGCAPTGFCPDGLVSREEMATFLARALKLTPTTPLFSDVGTGTHAQNIGAIATAGITTGCGAGLYCPFNAVTREQMATFLARAFKFAPVFPQIELVAGRFPWCSKDGLVCYLSLTVPLRGQYEINEGFYDLRDDPVLETAATRLEMTLNGVALSTADLGVVSTGILRRRNFRATTGLSPGTHTLVIRWYWNGFLEQTTNVIITARP